MNIELILLVLGLFVIYMLYDSKRKNGHIAAKTSVFKPSYERQSQILRQLHHHKCLSTKKKSVSIHLREHSFVPISQSDSNRINELVSLLAIHSKLYLLVKDTPTVNPIVTMLRSNPKVETISFQTTEGAVAILRQLSCGLHVESDEAVYSALSQYLGCFWEPQLSEVDLLLRLRELDQQK